MDVYVLYHWAVWLFIIKSTKPVRGYFLKTQIIRLAADKPARKPACRVSERIATVYACASDAILSHGMIAPVLVDECLVY